MPLRTKKVKKMPTKNKIKKKSDEKFYKNFENNLCLFKMVRLKVNERR